MHLFGLPITPAKLLVWLGLGLQLLALCSVPSVLIRRRANAVAAIGWILALLSVPALALPLWWVLGRNRLERKRRKRRHASREIAPRLEQVLEAFDPPLPEDPPLLPVRHLPEDMQCAVFPPTAGNRVRLLVDAQQAYACMLEAIAQARHHVHLLFYTWNDDVAGRRIRDALVARARAGVQVRLLCDAVGSSGLGRRFSAPLERAGGAVAKFMPFRLGLRAPRFQFRNHRKLVVVDGQQGFIGGINVGDEYLGDWHDIAVCLQGPAVDQLQEVFADDWYFTYGEDLADYAYFGKWAPPSAAAHSQAACAVVASGPDSRENPMHDMLFLAINEARERLWVATPYFIPTAPIMAALRGALYRGVDLRLLLPARSDVPLVRRAGRAFYPDLLGAGARLFEYSPAILHAKVAVFDGDLALVGSANMDTRSFQHNFEASCFIRSSRLNTELAAMLQRDFAASEEVELAKFERRPWLTQAVDSAAHLLSPLL